MNAASQKPRSQSGFSAVTVAKVIKDSVSAVAVKAANDAALEVIPDLAEIGRMIIQESPKLMKYLPPNAIAKINALKVRIDAASALAILEAEEAECVRLNAQASARKETMKRLQAAELKMRKLNINAATRQERISELKEKYPQEKQLAITAT